VVEVLVRNEQGLDLLVLQHHVDALALEALVHPLVGPAAVEQVFVLLAVHFLELDQAGEAAGILGMHRELLGDGPGLFEIVGQQVLDLGDALFVAPLPSPVPSPKGGQL
jgi:hypothetical protein